MDTTTTPRIVLAGLAVALLAGCGGGEPEPPPESPATFQAPEPEPTTPEPEPTPTNPATEATRDALDRWFYGGVYPGGLSGAEQDKFCDDVDLHGADVMAVAVTTALPAPAEGWDMVAATDWVSLACFLEWN
ncbi:hypothetical protein [Georgenia sp. AZ-5]|uniref:hypothetical protein n=1 Tax=Georgenia sp. AZ-5 TaxID=3367526 RepID=UPI0037543157